MNDGTNIREKVLTYLAKTHKRDRTYFEHPGWISNAMLKSFDVVNLYLFCENEFGVTLDVAAVDTVFNSIDSVTEAIMVASDA